MVFDPNLHAQHFDVCRRIGISLVDHFTNHPMVEGTFIFLLHVGVGVGAVLLPILLLTRIRVIAFIIGVTWTMAGLGFTFFDALNYFTHIGLIIHTS